MGYAPMVRVLTVLHSVNSVCEYVITLFASRYELEKCLATIHFTVNKKATSLLWEVVRFNAKLIV
jgi:hypothetical protein